MKFIDTIGKKIGFGFVLLAVVLVATVLVTLNYVGDITDLANRIKDNSEPSSTASIELKANLNKSIADLRGAILLNSEISRNSRLETWINDIHPGVTKLENLSAEWSSTESLELFLQLRPLLNQLEEEQEIAEKLSLTDSDSAIALIDNQIVPLNRSLQSSVDQLIEYRESSLTAAFASANNEITFLRNLLWILLVSGLLISIFLAYAIIISITTPIDEAVNVAKSIGGGNLKTDVNVGGSRELEILGNSLKDMRDALREREEEARLHDWLTTGQNKLGNVMRGDQEKNELADHIISFLAQYIHAGIGSIYLTDESNKKLELAGKYAFNNEDEIQSIFEINEGLVGQAASEKKTLFLNGMDEKQIFMKSSAIEVPPKNILATPFIINGEVLGVIEIGKFEEFTEAQIEFIESNLENIAISIQSAVAREKIQQLLEETQLQSEELQQQQEELQQNNEELEEQTQKLKEQQEELQAANEELEEQTQIVEQKNQALESARNDIELKAKQLEISSMYKSEFLANMSHELRTPLNSLLILSNDLLKNKNGHLDKEELESAEVIVNSGKDLLNLINEILDLSKIESGKMELNISEVKLEAFVSELARKFKQQADEKGITFEVHQDMKLPAAIHTDRQRLEQVLKNLLSNAIKFTDSGKVTMSFLYDSGGYLSVEIKDTGIGIPEDKLDVIFEAFQQAEGGTARRYGGTGLGLSISRELTKLMNGRIKVESKEGVGSTFTFTIPLNLPVSSTQFPAIEKRKPAMSKDHRYYNFPTIEDQRDEITSSDNVILIIEDDHDFARIIADQSNRKGFKYIAASTGEDGLVLAEKFKPTAIILDLKLPGIDGHTVLKELKANPEVRHIPVHIMSIEETSLETMKTGAVQFITKPVSKKQLESAFGRIEDFVKREMKTLLIVEDDDTLRKSIVKLVGNGDVIGIEARNGQEAMDRIKSNTIDCIVLDIGLPDMSGFELIRKLENESSIETPPIIVYTGKELTKKETEQLQEYAETIIVKGIKSEERLLDETALFLHRTVGNLPKAQQQIITSLYDKEKIFLNKKIMLVDDDMRNVFALSKVLREKGMNIIKAENGRVAIDLLEENPDTDLVLMDIMMPEMDGYECMKRIRLDDRFKDLPLIALTAKAMKNDRQKCLDAGADDYIAKPVDIDRLLSLMRIWIKK